MLHFWWDYDSPNILDCGAKIFLLFSKGNLSIETTYKTGLDNGPGRVIYN